jgi:hypothetical protein
VVPVETLSRPLRSVEAPDIQFTTGGLPVLNTRQVWEGTVTEVLPSGFVAILRDQTNSSNPDEQATFSFDNTEISDDDQSLLAPGAGFYWVLGNERTPAKQSRNVSMLQFRRIPAWTGQKLQRLSKSAQELRKSLQEKK